MRSVTLPAALSAPPRGGWSRAAALPAVVLFVAAAAAVAVIVVAAAYSSASRDAGVAAQRAGEEEVAAAIDAVVAELDGDLSRLLDEVVEIDEDEAAARGLARPVRERPRLCDGDAVVAGQAWPDGCGAAWDYVDDAAAEGAGAVGEAVRVEVSPPSVDDPEWVVRGLVRRGRIDVGVERRYAAAEAGRFALVATGGDVRLGEFADGSAVDGGVYSAGTVFLPPSEAGVMVGVGHVVGECAVVGQAPDAAVRLATSAADAGVGCDSPGGGVGDARDVVAAPLSTADAETGVAAAAAAACHGDGELGDDGYARGGCVAAGATVVDVDGGDAVVLPEDVAAWRLRLDGDEIAVDASAAALPEPSSCGVRCAERVLGEADTHAGDDEFWEQAARIAWPREGVVAADADVVVVGDAAAPLTVVAGTPGGRADVVVGGDVTGEAPVALAASGRVVVPWWAAGAGEDLTVDADVLAVDGDAAAPSLLGAPPRLGRGDDDPARGGVLRLGGAVAVAEVDGAALAGWERVEVDAAGARDEVAPHAPGLSGTVEVRAQAPLRGVDVCDAPSCDAF